MAVLNLTTLRSELLEKIKAKSGAIANARLDRWLNMAVDDVTRAIDSNHLVDETTITAASAIRVYYVPDCQPRGIISIIDTTNDTPLSKVSEEEIERIDPDLDDSGSARYYNNYGFTEYQGQPLTANVVRIVSNSASDTTQTVRITGLVNSVFDNESLTINGTTNVNSTKSFSAVYGIRKSATSVGRFQINSVDASTTVLAYIAPDALIRQYQPFRVWNVPTSTDSLRVRFYRQARPMINAQDVPDVSSHEFHELVLIAAAIRGHRDLFDHEIADKLLVAEWAPFINQYAKRQGKDVTDKSPVIGESALSGYTTMLAGRYGYPVDI